MIEKKKAATFDAAISGEQKTVIITQDDSKKNVVICDVCGYANPENTAICKMCSNYLKGVR